jgi:hypothetical protein
VTTLAGTVVVCIICILRNFLFCAIFGFAQNGKLSNCGLVHCRLGQYRAKGKNFAYCAKWKTKRNFLFCAIFGFAQNRKLSNCHLVQYKAKGKNMFA